MQPVDVREEEEPVGARARSRAPAAASSAFTFSGPGRRSAATTRGSVPRRAQRATGRQAPTTAARRRARAPVIRRRLEPDLVAEERHGALADRGAERRVDRGERARARPRAPPAVVTRRPPTNSHRDPGALHLRARSAARRRARRTTSLLVRRARALCPPSARPPRRRPSRRGGSRAVVRVDADVVVGEVARQVAGACREPRPEIEVDRAARPGDVGLDVGRRARVEDDACRCSGA